MQTIVEENLNDLSSISSKEQSLVYKILPAAFSNVPFHQDTASVTRYFAAYFFHLAVYEVSQVITPPPEYAEPHLHQDYDESNTILLKRNYCIVSIRRENFYRW